MSKAFLGVGGKREVREVNLAERGEPGFQNKIGKV